MSGSRLDQRSDVFSLGAVFYELLSGHPPFAGSSVDEVIASVTLATPPPITSYREDAPSGLNPIVAKALAKDVNARYRTMGELARDLRNLAAQEQGWILKRLLTSLFESKSKRQGGGEGQVELIQERSFVEDIVHFFKLYWRILLASFLALVGIAIAATSFSLDGKSLAVVSGSDIAASLGRATGDNWLWRADGRRAM